MIKYSCPKCKQGLEAPEERIGTMHACPSCRAQVQVPSKSQGSNLPLILGIVGGLLILGTCMCGIVSLAAIQVLGTNANSSFGTVGASIGATVTNGK